MRKRSVAAACAGGILIALVLGGCGGKGGSSPTSPSSTTQSQPTVQVLPTQTFTNLSPEAAQFADLRIDSSGVTAEIEANWTFGYNDVDVFVTGTACNASSYDTLYFQVGACASLARGVGVTRPERLNASLAAGSYRVYVASSSLSQSAESGTLAITLRR